MAIKGMNILWGTALYAAAVFATYAGAEATISTDAVARLPGVAIRSIAADKRSGAVAKYRASRLSGTKASAQLQKAFQEKTWVR